MSNFFGVNEFIVILSFAGNDLRSVAFVNAPSAA